MKNYKILPGDVAKLIGKSELTVREGIKREFYDFGVAWQNDGCVRWNYTIYPAKVAEFLGIPVGELYEQVSALRKGA